MNLEKLHENVYYYRNAIADPAALIELINSTEGEEGISKVVPSWDHWESCSGECYIYGEKKNLNIENMLFINNDESKEKAQKHLSISLKRDGKLKMLIEQSKLDWDNIKKNPGINLHLIYGTWQLYSIKQNLANLNLYDTLERLEKMPK